MPLPEPWSRALPAAPKATLMCFPELVQSKCDFSHLGWVIDPISNVGPSRLATSGNQQGGYHVISKPIVRSVPVPLPLQRADRRRGRIRSSFQPQGSGLNSVLRTSSYDSIRNYLPRLGLRAVASFCCEPGTRQYERGWYAQTGISVTCVYIV